MKFQSKNGTINIIQRIGPYHTEFGIFLLNDKNGVITAAIAQECMGNAYQINQEVLMKWLQGKGRHPVSWKTLVDVLKSIELNVLATDIGDSLQVSRSLIFTVCLIPFVVPSLPPKNHTHISIRPLPTMCTLNLFSFLLVPVILHSGQTWD